MNKVHPFIPRIILSGSLILYLVFTLLNREFAESLILVFLSFFLLVYTYFKPHNELEKKTESIYSSFGILIGALLTHFLSYKFNVILAAGLVGFFGSFLINIKRMSDFPPAVYCGAFIGMSSTQNLWFIISASLIAMYVYSISKSYVTKVGGRLGTFAFIGVLFTFLMIKLWSYL